MLKISRFFLPFILLILAGCTSQPLLEKDEGTDITPLELPGWVLSPQLDGYLCGVGHAPQQKTNPAYQRRVAMMQARAEIARAIELFVKTELAMEKRCRDEACRSAMTIRSQHLSQQLIGETEVRNEWTDPKTGVLYIRLVTKKQRGE